MHLSQRRKTHCETQPERKDVLSSYFSVSRLVSMGTRAQIDSRYLKTNNLCAALSDYFGVDLCVLFVGFAPWWCFITAVISLPDITWVCVYLNARMQHTRPLPQKRQITLFGCRRTTVEFPAPKMCPRHFTINLCVYPFLIHWFGASYFLCVNGLRNCV